MITLYPGGKYRWDHKRHVSMILKLRLGVAPVVVSRIAKENFRDRYRLIRGKIDYSPLQLYCRSPEDAALVRLLGDDLIDCAIDTGWRP